MISAIGTLQVIILYTSIFPVDPFMKVNQMVKKSKLDYLIGTLQGTRQSENDKRRKSKKGDEPYDPDRTELFLKFFEELKQIASNPGLPVISRRKNEQTFRSLKPISQTSLRAPSLKSARPLISFFAMPFRENVRMMRMTFWERLKLYPTTMK